MPEEKVLYHATLVFPIKGRQVLLAKKVEKIGAGCWNGYGGGIELGETPEECAVRELRQESSVMARPEALQKTAIMDFHNLKKDGEVFVCQVHVFLLREWQGDFATTKEMAGPAWFDISNLPIAEMMLADPDWVPAALAPLPGKIVVGEAYYGPFQKTLLGPVKISYVDYPKKD